MAILLILSGLFLMVAIQVAIFCIAIVKSPGNAVLCLIVPFFVYVYARKEPRARPFLWAWYTGIGLLTAGVIASS
ncbi:hypothetical protein DNJ95_00380 [Stutzerimonas kirkiae]|uniref:Uncharacterized protein n=1 Tax=Stutzerimonas kirkiae TaxID=2211392 RepID=A0A4V2KDH2_9GAMM|nr:hypothetical protein DNJ96_03420 [Stutzerimonas kirkiae]TBV04486.1 hypothetical protein DNK08_16940 [Stutzerimonas kirkiae]TBV06173.1 hypothetical protein DNJ95_00380 [Stutzerimonas kirkiae]TBV11920.1 hypothetical protein DNK01_15850 [Stutzerimonas kirkiae]